MMYNEGMNANSNYQKAIKTLQTGTPPAGTDRPIQREAAQVLALLAIADAIYEVHRAQTGLAAPER